jgi:hypothetical protein
VSSGKAIRTQADYVALLADLVDQYEATPMTTTDAGGGLAREGRRVPGGHGSRHPSGQTAHPTNLPLVSIRFPPTSRATRGFDGLVRIDLAGGPDLGDRSRRPSTKRK